MWLEQEFGSTLLQPCMLLLYPLAIGHRSVVTGENNHSIRGQPLTLKSIQQPSHLVIKMAHIGVVFTRSAVL